jgi:release factor glutamine methyltransferase
VSNPPYVARSELASLPTEVRDFEPAVALFSGPDGLEALETVIREAPRHLKCGGLLALEIAPALSTAVVDRIRGREAYGEPRVHRDLAGHLRFVLAESAADPQGSEASDG